MTRPGVGEAERLDIAQAEHLQAEIEGAARSYAGLLVLLRECRGHLPIGSSLATQIDDVLNGKVEPEPAEELVYESYGRGYAWLRRAA